MTDSPEAVLRAAIDMRDRLDYAGVIALCDPASVELVFRERCEMLRPRTEAECREDYPDFTDVQIAGMVSYFEERSTRQLSNSGLGITTYDELIGLAPSEFFRRSLERQDVRCDLIRRMRERGRPVPDAMFQPFPGVAYEMVATEPTGANEVNVTYRDRTPSQEDVSPEQLEHEQLRRISDGVWRLVARHDMLHSRGSVATIIDGVFDLFEPHELG
jgi:hypothetical protein